MRKYTLLFAGLVLLVNLAYAVTQLGTGKDTFISRPLLLGSIGGAAVGLVALQKRIRDANNPRQD